MAAVGAERRDAELSGAATGQISERGARAALRTGNRERSRPGRAEGREGKRRGARRSPVRVCLSASARLYLGEGFPEAGVGACVWSLMPAGICAALSQCGHGSAAICTDLPAISFL